MKIPPTSAEIVNLFNNNDPHIVWEKISGIICCFIPGYDFTQIKPVFDDVVRLFRGEYTGYCEIKTPYHNLMHTLEVLLCGVRLMHGVNLSGDFLNDDEVTKTVIAMLMHDVGYAQRKGEENGTGAQHTQIHVQRGIEFMRNYFSRRGMSEQAADSIASMMLATEHFKPFSNIKFADDRTQMLACIVATADITSQMADRAYLEKLLYLYQEFNEAQFGNFQSLYEMQCQTR